MGSCADQADSADPYVGPVLALMGPKAMKEIISSVVIVLLLYVAHVKSKNVR